MNQLVKQLLLWLAVLTAAFCVYTYIGNRAPKVENVSLPEVMMEAQLRQVKDVMIDGTTMTGHYASGTEFRTTIQPNDSEMMYKVLRDSGVTITIRDENNFWVNLLVLVLPFMLVLGLCLALFWIYRRFRLRRAQPPVGPPPAGN